MRRSQFRLLADILRDYPRLENYIDSRKDEIINPPRIHDENHGGSRSGNINKSVEHLAVRLADDRLLQQLERQFYAITKLLTLTDDETHYIIERLYFKRFSSATIQSLAIELHTSEMTIKRKRQAFFNALSEELSIYTMPHGENKNVA